jgi:hypothetical protein
LVVAVLVVVLAMEIQEAELQVLVSLETTLSLVQLLQQAAAEAQEVIISMVYLVVQVVVQGFMDMAVQV